VPDKGGSRPELDSQRLALIVQNVADHHLRTLRYQQASLRGTLAACAAAHEHHLVVEACHVRSPDTNHEVWQIGRPGSKSGAFSPPSGVILKIIWRRSLRIIWRAGRLCRSPRSGARWAIWPFAGPSASTVVSA